MPGITEPPAARTPRPTTTSTTVEATPPSAAAGPSAGPSADSAAGPSAAAGDPLDITTERALPIADLEEVVVGEAGRIAAATCRWLLLLAEFDRREGWGRSLGVRSMAHWLSWRCGIGRGTASEQVRVARVLSDLPLVTQAFAAGRLSYSQVRALTRAVGLLPEDELLHLAEHSTGAQLERLVSGLRRAATASDEAERRRRRTAHWFVDDDGTVVVRARLTADEGAAVVAALDAALGVVSAVDQPTEAVPVGDSATGSLAPGGETAPAGSRPSVGTDGRAHARARADALVELARVYAAAPAAIRGAADSDRVQVVLHADLRALAAAAATSAQPAPDPLSRSDGRLSRSGSSAEDTGDRPLPADADPSLSAPGGMRCGFEAASGVHPSVLARLLCDRQVRLVAELAGGAGVDLGRARRTVSARLRSAVLRRDGSACRYPGCGARRHLHLHHVQHWIAGGPTDAGNLITLCGFHHRRLHEDAFTIGCPEPGHFTFRLRGGTRLHEHPAVRPDQRVPPLPHDPTLGAAATAARAVADTPARGEPVDLDYAVSVLLA